MKMGCLGIWISNLIRKGRRSRWMGFMFMFMNRGGIGSRTSRMKCTYIRLKRYRPI